MLSERDISKILMGQLISLINDQKYSYTSERSPEYSHLTEDGENIMLECIRMLTPKVVILEKQRLQEHAESLMINKLAK